MIVIERVLDDPARAAALIDAGGRLERHSNIMVLDLTQPPIEPAPCPPGYSIAPMVVERAAEYGPVMASAYPADHPDHDPGDCDPDVAAATIRRYCAGEEVGPWIAAASLHVVDHSDRIVGAIVLNQAESGPVHPAGPLVTDVFVAPEAAGIGLGGALLSAAAQRLGELGWSSVVLAVTVGNPAQRLYRRVGFRVSAEAWRIDVVERGEPGADTSALRA